VRIAVLVGLVMEDAQHLAAGEQGMPVVRRSYRDGVTPGCICQVLDPGIEDEDNAEVILVEEVPTRRQQQHARHSSG
jgi:hypothetical protein